MGFLKAVVVPQCRNMTGPRGCRNEAKLWYLQGYQRTAPSHVTCPLTVSYANHGLSPCNNAVKTHSKPNGRAYLFAAMPLFTSICREGFYCPWMPDLPSLQVCQLLHGLFTSDSSSISHSSSPSPDCVPCSAGTRCSQPPGDGFVQSL